MQRPALYALPGRGTGAVASPAPIRLVLADDYEIVRRTLRRQLDAETEFEIVAEASDVPMVLRHVRAHRPHVVVLDVAMPGGSSLTAIRQLHAEAPDTRIVVTTMLDDPRFAREAIAAGASGYVLKETADRDLPEAIRRAAADETFVTPSVAAVLAAYTNGGDDALSQREVDVLRLIALGHTNTEIARLLQISIRTVETHRARIHRKLGLATRAELVAYALGRGLLTVPPARGNN
jgi:two-component system response regulator NreC